MSQPSHLVSSLYIDLPTNTKTAMEKVIRENGLNASSKSIIWDVADFVSGYLPYDLYTRNYQGDYAEYFFTKAESALCRHYATAAVALYRTLGIPARYVAGYVGSAEAGETAIVTAMEGHAWVEVYIDGLGWIPMEVTGAGGIPGIGDGDTPDDDEEEELIKLEIKPLDIIVRYDPENPTVYAQNVLDPTSLQEYLDKGYRYEVLIEGSQTGYGFSYSTIVESSFVLYDPYDRPVTDKFEITFKQGLITVYGEFLIEIAKVSITYDGQEHSYTDYEQYMNWYKVTCPEGYNIVLDGSALSMRGVGTMTMEEIANAPCMVYYNGVLIENFDKSAIAFAGTPMTIKKRTIVMEAGSETAVFEEGKILENDTVTAKLGGLVSGHWFDATTKGYLDKVGTEKNKVDKVVIYDENDIEVTDCYEIIKVDGVLKFIADE